MQQPHSIFTFCLPAKQQTNTHSDAAMSSKFTQQYVKNEMAICCVLINGMEGG